MIYDAITPISVTVYFDATRTPHNMTKFVYLAALFPLPADDAKHDDDNIQ